MTTDHSTRRRGQLHLGNNGYPGSVSQDICKISSGPLITRSFLQYSYRIFLLPDAQIVTCLAGDGMKYVIQSLLIWGRFICFRPVLWLISMLPGYRFRPVCLSMTRSPGWPPQNGSVHLLLFRFPGFHWLRKTLPGHRHTAPKRVWQMLH